MRSPNDSAASRTCTANSGPRLWISARRWWRIARFSASASSATTRLEVTASICEPIAATWRSSSPTMRPEMSTCRSMFDSSLDSECTRPRSRSISRWSRSRSRRISSRRCWLRWRAVSAGAGCWAAALTARQARRHSRVKSLEPCPSLNTPQVPADADEAAEQAEDASSRDPADRLRRGEERGLDQVGVDERVGAVREAERDHAAQQPLEEPLEQERAPDEPVGRADQPHDGYLAAALEDRHPDRRADDDDRDDCERGAHHDPDGARDVAEPVELLDPVAAVAHVVHEREAAQPVGHRGRAPGVAEPRLEPHLERGGQGVGLEVLEDVLELAQVAPGAGEGLRLGEVRDALDLGDCFD